jgi:transglutaminase-like putative cysteine protease
VCYQFGVYERVGGFKVTRGTLPRGDAGTRKTVAIMQRLAHEGSNDLEVREAAIDIVRQAGVPSHDRYGELRALYVFVRDRIRFTNDILGVETLQGARYTLSVRAGDCDDRAVLLSALAMSIGIPAMLSFRVIAVNPSRPRSFSHVYVVARLKGRRIALDPTYENNPLGWEYPSPFRASEVNV